MNYFDPSIGNIFSIPRELVISNIGTRDANVSLEVINLYVRPITLAVQYATENTSTTLKDSTLSKTNLLALKEDLAKQKREVILDNTLRGAGYAIPILGTGLAWLDFARDPGWLNGGLAVLSTVGDLGTLFFGSGEALNAAVAAAKAANTASKTAKVLKGISTGTKVGGKTVAKNLWRNKGSIALSSALSGGVAGSATGYLVNKYF